MPFFSTGLFESTRVRIGQSEGETSLPASSLLFPAVRLALLIPALPRRTMFPLLATYFRQPLPPVIGATVSKYLWADLTPYEPSAALLLVELAYLAWRLNVASPPFRLRHTSVSGFPLPWLNIRMSCGGSFLIPVSDREPAGSPKFLTLLYMRATL